MSEIDMIGMNSWNTKAAYECHRIVGVLELHSSFYT